MAARREQDLKHLLRPGAPQVSRTQRAGAVFDLERPEQADHEAPPLLFFCTHALRHPQSIELPFLCGAVVSADRVPLFAGTIRYTRSASAQTQLLRLRPGRSR